MASLVCTHGDNYDDVFPIKDGVNRIGRSTECEIKLRDRSCSRSHAVVVKKGSTISVEDSGSKHGTLINGKKLNRRTRLKFGDRIQVGHTVLRLGEGEAADADRIAADLSHQAHTQEMEGSGFSPDDAKARRKRRTRKKARFKPRLD